MDPYKKALHEKTGCTWPACWPTDAQRHFALYLAEKELREIIEANEEQLKTALAASEASQRALREAIQAVNDGTPVIVQGGFVQMHESAWRAWMARLSAAQSAATPTVAQGTGAGGE